jgi:hypothetical protein
VFNKGQGIKNPGVDPQGLYSEKISRFFSARPQQFKISFSVHPRRTHVAFDDIEIYFFVSGDYDGPGNSALDI